MKLKSNDKNFNISGDSWSLRPWSSNLMIKTSIFQVTVGVYGHEEEVLDKPISPNELKHILYSKCMPYDMQQAVLQQEIILSIGKLIATASELFDGILKIRIGWEIVFPHSFVVMAYNYRSYNIKCEYLYTIGNSKLHISSPALLIWKVLIFMETVYKGDSK